MIEKILFPVDFSQPDATLYIMRGPVKDALFEAARQISADVLIVGRPQCESLGRLRNLNLRRD